MKLLVVVFIAISILTVKFAPSSCKLRRQDGQNNSSSLCECSKDNSTVLDTPDDVKSNCSSDPLVKDKEPTEEPPPSPEEEDEEEAPPPPVPPPPPDLVPLGWEKFLLLVVPQFKINVPRTAKWWKANVKFSFPITVFFDKLGIPSGAPPLIFFPFGTFLGPRGRRRRSLNNSEAILSLPPPDSVRGGERATILPRLEVLLKSYGVEGRACLLRALCEVHQTALAQSYGFFGEILTLLFTVSHSAYADSHMPEYLKAEQMGRAGRCSSYFPNCEVSLFHSDDDDDDDKFYGPENNMDDFNYD